MNSSLENPETPTPETTVLPTEDNHRGNGKIARLPKILRDQVNRMLDDGVPYKAIIEKLEQSTDPPLPYKLLEINISRWKDIGYQKYLRHQEWRDQLRILRENGSEMSELTDGPKFQETLVQIALTEIFRVLQERELKPDSLNYIRLFNALARLNREALGLRKYNDQLAKEQAELKQLDPDRDFSKNEHRALADRADRIFRMPRPAPDETETPRSLWSAPAERSGDGALADLSAATDLKTPSRCAEPIHAEVSAIENPKSKIQNPLSPLPSRPCQADALSPSSSSSSSVPSIKNAVPEYCLECHATLPPVPPSALRRPDDHCPSCGIRLPDIGLCYQIGFDHCLSCGATQPALLPGGERPRPYCHKCGERLHNPEPPAA